MITRIRLVKTQYHSPPIRKCVIFLSINHCVLNIVHKLPNLQDICTYATTNWQSLYVPVNKENVTLRVYSGKEYNWLSHVY